MPAVTKPPVSDFTIKEEKVVVPANAVVQTQVSNLRASDGSSRFNASTVTRHHINLSFTYMLDDNIKEFQILRSITSGPTEVYRTVTLEEAMGQYQIYL